MRLRRKVFYSCAGSPLKVQYDVVQTPDGNFNLIENGFIDIQEEIDSYAESCSIEHIIALCAAGDTSALNRCQGSFIDTSVMPKTYRDILDIVIRGRAEFDNLPVDVRNKFGSDFMSWFSSAGQPEWMEKMGFVVKSDSASEKVGDSNAES